MCRRQAGRDSLQRGHCSGTVASVLDFAFLVSRLSCSSSPRSLPILTPLLTPLEPNARRNDDLGLDLPLPVVQANINCASLSSSPLSLSSSRLFGRYKLALSLTLRYNTYDTSTPSSFPLAWMYTPSPPTRSLGPLAHDSLFGLVLSLSPLPRLSHLVIFARHPRFLSMSFSSLSSLTLPHRFSS